MKLVREEAFAEKSRSANARLSLDSVLAVTTSIVL
jgi:hypothetical protein